MPTYTADHFVGTPKLFSFFTLKARVVSLLPGKIIERDVVPTFTTDHVVGTPKLFLFFALKARVVKLVDTQVSEACGRKAVLVQVQSRAQTETTSFGASFLF